MQYTNLGECFETSRLILGGGGIGQVWGETDRGEAIATVIAAYDAGINCFDMAPLYGDGEAEQVMGLAFAGGYPDNVRLTTKCMLGDIPAVAIEDVLTQSLNASCERLGRDHIDVYFLHGYVIEDGWTDATRPEVLPQIAVPYSRYESYVIPTFEKLKAAGRIGAWGVTAASTQNENFRVMNADAKPQVVQCITNLLNTPGSMAITREQPDPRAVVQHAAERGIGVMGIRAVAAGSLVDKIDRSVSPKSAEQTDYDRAAGFRNIAARLNVTPAYLAHQYALSMPGVDAVVLGVKNRTELEECLSAEAAGPLNEELIQQIDLTVENA